MTAIAPLSRRLGALVLTLVCAVILARSTPARAEEQPRHETAGHMAPTTGEARTGSEHEGAHESPTLVPPPGVTQIITSLTTLVVFGLLVVVLGKYAWGPIVKGLEAREHKIRKEIKDAEEAREKAEATLKEYNTRLATAEQQVRDLLAKATADAEQIAAGVRTRASQEAEEIKEKATRDIDNARKQAVAEVYEQAASLSTSIAEKILKRSLNADDQRDLVNRSLEQLGSVGTN